MSTDHSSSMPPFDMGSQSIDINQPPISAPASMVNAGIQGSVPTGFPTNDDTDALAAELGKMHGGNTTSMPGPKVDAIEFRVIRPGVPVRRLRLTGSRYTFGSAEGCSIRLNDPTLRPMHAVLIRDASRVLVRAYSVPLEVNGNRMTETSLQIGDVMRMGAYRFELLSGLDPAATLASSTDHLASSFEASGELDQQAFASRLQREAAQWRIRQSEVDLRENRCIERETELRSREAEIWSRADQLQRRESQLMSQETAALQIQEEYTARKEELARLREESSVQRRLLDERQDQIQNMESEYQNQVDNATRQLELSQQQAESATEAVQRMREQFASLNEQLERLTHQQNELESSDQSHMEQHRQLQLELENARDEAIDARAQSEALREKAEARVAELTAEVASIQSEASAKADQLAQQESMQESMTAELRDQIDELEDRVRQATEEASSLRDDYEGACASIRQLELLVDQTSSERDEARGGLEIESDALRQSVEQLNRDLGQANVELAELRAANQSLTSDLSDTCKQRDEAIEEVQSRPSNEAFEALSVELDTVKARLEQMQKDYDETLSRIDSYGTEASSSPKLDEPIVSSGAEFNADVSSPKVQALLGTSVDYQPPSESEMAVEPAVEPATEAVTEEAAEESTEEAAWSAEADVESAEEDDCEAWPTYESPSQEVDSELPSDSSPSEVTGSGSGSGSDSDSDSDSDSEIAEEVNPWQTATADEVSELTEDIVDEDSMESESQWRPDGHQAPESSAHLSAWNMPEAGPTQEPELDSESSPETGEFSVEVEPAEFDETPSVDASVWQDESPEVAVDEAIANIEQNVDQAIGEVDGISSEMPSQAPAETEDVVSHDEIATETSAQDEELLNPWATSPTSEPEADIDQPTDEVEVSPYQNMWDREEDEDSPEASEDDSSGGYQAIDPWSQMTPDSSDAAEEEVVAGSLADMLIRDMDNDLKEGSASDSCQDESQESPSDVDSVESTFVMDSAGPEAEDDDDHSNGWDLERPEDVSSEDVLDEQSAVATEADQSPSAHEPVEPEAISPEPDAEEEDDDSIEAYMNRLLKRVQTDSGTPDSESQPETKSVSMSMSGQTTAMKTSSGGATTELAPEPIDTDAPMVPRSQAPERSRNMTAMRDLANHSARSAVARSVRIQARDTQVKAVYKFLGALTGIACALLCIYFHTELGFLWCATCTTLGIIVALMYSQEGLSLMNEANKRIQAAESGEDTFRQAVPSSQDAVAQSADVAENVAENDGTEAPNWGSTTQDDGDQEPKA